MIASRSCKLSKSNMGIAIAPAKVAVLVVVLLIGHDWSQEASLSRRGSDVAIAYEYTGAGRVEKIFSADGLHCGACRRRLGVKDCW